MFQCFLQDLFPGKAVSEITFKAMLSFSRYTLSVDEMNNAIASNNVVKILDRGEWTSFSALCRYHLSQLCGYNNLTGKQQVTETSANGFLFKDITYINLADIFTERGLKAASVSVCVDS